MCSIPPHQTRVIDRTARMSRSGSPSTSSMSARRRHPVRRRRVQRRVSERVDPGRLRHLRSLARESVPHHEPTESVRACDERVDGWPGRGLADRRGPSGSRSPSITTVPGGTICLPSKTRTLRSAAFTGPRVPPSAPVNTSSGRRKSVDRPNPCQSSLSRYRALLPGSPACRRA